MTQPSLEAYWGWQSWIDSANQPGCDFPLQNLPFCAMSAGSKDIHLGLGIGDAILDLHQAANAGLLDTLGPSVVDACREISLNALMASGREASSLLRQRLMLLLRDDAAPVHKATLAAMLRPRQYASFQMPVTVGNYTDFYASIHHATNVGRLFRPDQPLLPNYKHVPIGYHGRASSLVISGTVVTRPSGQIKTPNSEIPVFAPSQQLDYELEVGAYVGSANRLGEPILIDDAEQSIFGVSLVNDWSARDIQAWEYQPLGPFLGKSFCTSVSPWVVSMEALAPFRVPVAPRAIGDPEPLPYLSSASIGTGAINMQVEVFLSTEAMRKASREPVRLSVSNLRDLYWSFAQLVTHHTSNGCNLLRGDLLASGTISGPVAGSLGSLLEQTRHGSEPLRLPTNEIRAFLSDGDEVILRGFCERPGFPRIGLGECRGIIAPAIS